MPPAKHKESTRAGHSFVGRAREMAQLHAGLGDAIAGRRRLFLVTGEAGIGKTRLTEELSRQATRRGAQVLWGRCWEGGGAPPYWPWLESIRAHARRHQPHAVLEGMGDLIAEIARMIPELRHLAAEHPIEVGNSADARSRLFDAVATFLTQASRSQPLILVLDDLHVADRDSLLLLEFVANTLGTASVMIVVTYRDAEARRQPDLEPLFSKLETLGRHIALTGLSEIEVGDFLRQFQAEYRAPANGSARSLHEATGGNPFFLDAVARLLLSEESDEGKGQGAIGRTLPEHVLEVIRRRIRLLPAATRSVLELVAVSGREFDAAVAQRLMASDASHMRTLLDPAIDDRMLAAVEGTPRRYRFAHALIPEALAAQLPLQRRAELHRQIGHAMEDLYEADIENHISELAYHFVHGALAGDGQCAIDYSMRAAEQATQALAFAEAVRHYRAAYDVSEICSQSLTNEQRPTLLLTLAGALDLASDYREASAVFLRAADAARAHGNAELLARAALGAGGSWGYDVAQSGDAGGAAKEVYGRLVDAALEGIGEAPSRLRARLLARRAQTLYLTPHSLERRLALCNEAVDLARQVADPPTLWNCLLVRQIATWGPDTLEQRLADSAEAVRVAESVGDEEPLLRAINWRIPSLVEATQTDEARSLTRVYTERARSRRRASHLWNAATIAAMWALFDGPLAAAGTQIQAAWDVGQSLHHSDVRDSFQAQSLWLAWEQGRLAELGPMIIDLVPKAPDLQAIVPLALLEMGETERARQELASMAQDRFKKVLAAEQAKLFYASVLAEACPAIGDTRSAQILYDLLLPAARRNIIVGDNPLLCVGVGARTLGRLAAMMSQWRVAEEWFETALALHTRMASRLWLAQTQYDYAQALLARGDAAACERGTALLGTALVTARELGMVRLECCVTQLRGDA